MEEVADNAAIFVVIPVFKEEALLKCLDSLLECNRPSSGIEVLIVFNSSLEDEEAIEHNQKSARALRSWQKENEPFFKLHIIEENNLSSKEAGVGIARKIGMDEAVRRSMTAKQPNGIIICLDGDCTVSNSYLAAIENYFLQKKSKGAVSIHFEHPLEGEMYAEEIYEAITLYELHLRYFKWAMNHIGIPYDRYTVGSSMAVKALAYAREGGMNKRKAGEDFYFLQKYLIKEDLDELYESTVFPSPRISDRVPFGTGRAIADHQERRKDLRLTYSSRSFELLKELIDIINSSYPELPEIGKEFKEFLKDDNWEEVWKKLMAQSKDKESFQSRFLQWFTPFRLLKFIHYLRDEYFSDEPLVLQVQKLKDIGSTDPKEQLLEIRERDKRKYRETDN